MITSNGVALIAALLPFRAAGNWCEIHVCARARDSAANSTADSASARLASLLLKLAQANVAARCRPAPVVSGVCRPTADRHAGEIVRCAPDSNETPRRKHTPAAR